MKKDTPETGEQIRLDVCLGARLYKRNWGRREEREKTAAVRQQWLPLKLFYSTRKAPIFLPVVLLRSDVIFGTCTSNQTKAVIWEFHTASPQKSKASLHAEVEREQCVLSFSQRRYYKPQQKPHLLRGAGGQSQVLTCAGLLARDKHHGTATCVSVHKYTAVGTHQMLLFPLWS